MDISEDAKLKIAIRQAIETLIDVQDPGEFNEMFEYYFGTH